MRKKQRAGPRVVKGMPSVELSRKEFVLKFPPASRDPAFKQVAGRCSRSTRWPEELHRVPQEPGTHGRRGKSFAKPDFPLSGRMAGGAQSRSWRPGGRNGRPRRPVAHPRPSTARRAAIRPARRDVKDLPLAKIAQRTIESARASTSIPRPVAAGFRVRGSDLSLQGLRLDRRSQGPLSTGLLGYPTSAGPDPDWRKRSIRAGWRRTA